MNINQELNNFIIETNIHTRVFLDTDSSALLNLFNSFKKVFYKFYVPEEFGGRFATKEQIIEFQIQLGKISGALAFLQAQSLLVIKILIDSSSSFQSALLSEIASGQMSVGNAISNLKPHSTAKLRGEKLDDGYLISGVLPFASGYGFFNNLLIAFLDEKNNENYILLPFEKSACISISEPLDTVAMQSTNAVSISLNEYFVSSKSILCVKPFGWLMGIYETASPFAYTLGVVARAYELIKNNHYLSHSLIAQKATVIRNGVQYWRTFLIETTQYKNPAQTMFDIMRFSYDSLEFCILLFGGTGLLRNSEMQCLLNELSIWSVPRVTENFLLS